LRRKFRALIFDQRDARLRDRQLGREQIAATRSALT
jgi:hypothetical protein